MVVRLAGVDGKENPFNPMPPSEEKPPVEPQGTRGGFFGTALVESSATSGRTVTAGGPMFTVTLDGAKQPAKQRNDRRIKGGRGQAQVRRVATADDLDAELESYMAQK